MFFLPGTHKEHGLAYSPLKALVSPRPIGWISSQSKDKIANLSPYSFFNAIAELPPMVMFISAPDAREENKDDQKDSLANLPATAPPQACLPPPSLRLPHLKMPEYR